MLNWMYVFLCIEKHRTNVNHDFQGLGGVMETTSLKNKGKCYHSKGIALQP